ncbi:MAG: MFS transporter [Candidatus Marsarchaeota archaeon]|nr:MFS transporter [Candidatus Marsarchaeota archaeon]
MTGWLTRDLSLIVGSRVLRNFAAGFLNVAVSLYLVEVLRYSYLNIGVVFGIASFAAPMLTIVFGFAGDIFGRKPMLVMGNSLLVVSCLLLLAERGYIDIVSASVLGSFGLAGGTVGGGVGSYVAPMQNALLAEKAPPGKLTQVYSYTSLLGGMASSAGAYLVNLADFQTLFTYGLILSAGSTLVTVFIKERQGRQKIRLGKISSGGAIAKFSVTGMLNGFGQGLVTPFFPILFHSVFHVSNGLVGDAMGAGTLASSLSMPVTPYLAKRLGFVKMIVVTRGISTLLLALFPFTPAFTVAVMEYGAITTTRMLALPAQQSLMMGMVSEAERSSATGINQASRLLPSSAATFLTGYALDGFPLELPFLLAVPVNLANLVLYKVFFGREKASP